MIKGKLVAGDPSKNSTQEWQQDCVEAWLHEMEQIINKSANERLTYIFDEDDPKIFFGWAREDRQTIKPDTVYVSVPYLGEEDINEGRCEYHFSLSEEVDFMIDARRHPSGEVFSDEDREIFNSVAEHLELLAKKLRNPE